MGGHIQQSHMMTLECPGGLHLQAWHRTVASSGLPCIAPLQLDFMLSTISSGSQPALIDVVDHHLRDRMCYEAFWCTMCDKQDSRPPKGRSPKPSFFQTAGAVEAFAGHSGTSNIMLHLRRHVCRNHIDEVALITSSRKSDALLGLVL